MTEKMKFETKDLIQENIAKIGQLFPEVLTEAKDDNGILKKAIDFDKLRQILSDKAINNRETYDFTWVGKKQAILEAATPIRKTLRPCKEESVNWDTTQNLYIEGDNLDVLKLLQDCYPNQVKMIYIDPPYNTGNDVFVYNDDFRVEKDEYEEQAQIRDEEGYKMRTNKDTSGRFHSEWCSMMYPRLKLARNLLTDDGVIFISIDDREVDNLRKICDEVFGAENFIANIVRNTNSSKNQSLFISVSHEYCLIYAKAIGYLKIKHQDNKWNVPKNNVEEYVAKVRQLKKEGLSQEEITEELKVLTKYPRFIDFTNYWYFDDKGLYQKGDLGGVANGNMTPLFNPITQKNDPVPPGGFRFNSEKLNQLVQENRIHFHTDGSLPRIKRYLTENLSQRPKSIMSDDQRPDNAMLEEFNTPFDNPKQLAFMQRIISIADKDSIILDFFSGSATTAHAVMKLNAEDGGNRKFIMVQLPEPCDEKSEAYKAGYKNICEIGKERIRRAAKQIKGEHPEANFDGGFRVFKLADSNMKDVYFSPSEYKQDLLSQMTSNIKENRTDMDLLYGCMLEWGLPLSYPHTSEKVGSYTIHTVNNGALMACFDENIPEDIIRHMATKKPRGVVFRDAGFTDSPAKINIGELFKLLSPDTKVKVI